MLKRPVNDFEIDLHREEKKKTFVGSRYEFLSNHNGLRPGCLHGMLGTTGCLAGDTKILVTRIGKRRTFTLKELCLKMGDYPGHENRKSLNENKANKIRTYIKEENRIGVRNFIRVVYSGVKDLWNLQLIDGKRISATLDHKIMTKDGMVELQSLEAGDMVMVDTKENSKITYSAVKDIWFDKKSECFDVYEVHGTNNFTANDIVVSNCGKSSLMKCLIAEFAVQSRVLVWLSEETVREYQELINYLDKSVLHNILFVEEKEITEDFKRTQSDFFEYFEQMVEKSGADIIVIDNATTSAFYNQRYGISGQNRSAEFLRSFPKRTGKTILYIAHTQSNISDNYAKVINAEDIRGSKELPLNTEYLYIIQKFTQNDKQFNVLRVAKYRHHEEAAGWYALKYEKKAYIGDSRVPFSLVNRIFKSRDYFGRSDKNPGKPKTVPDREKDILPKQTDLYIRE